MNALKRAIVQTVKKYEILNCKILQDEKGECYYVPKDKWENPEIIVRTEIMNNELFNQTQAKYLFDFENGKLIRFFIQDTAQGMYLSIVQHHLVGDGKSIVLLLSDIMASLNKEDSLDDISKVPIKLFTSDYLNKFINEDPSLKDVSQRLNQEWKRGNARFDLESYPEIYQNYLEKNRSFLKTVKIQKSEYIHFCDLCKKNNVSINTAILTMIARSIGKINNLTVAADLRNADYSKLGNYASSFCLNLSYNRDKTFWENAKDISQEVDEYLKNRMKLASGLVFRSMFESGIIDAANLDMDMECVNQYKDIFFFGKDGIPIFLSNLGKVKTCADCKTYNIEELSFISPLMSIFQCNISIISINNCMVINLIYRTEDSKYEMLLDAIVNQIRHI